MSTHPVPVVVAVDGTDRSAGAIRFAVQEARARGTGLVVVHVSPSYTPMTPMLPMVPMVDTMPALVEAESRKLIDGIVAEISARAPDLDVEPVLMRGSRSSAIVQAASSAAVLVVGRETRTGVERLTSGATTLKVAARAHCPVAVVPSEWQPGPLTHRLVVGVGATTHAADLVVQAFDLAATRKDSLLVLHAWRLPDPYLDRLEGRTDLDQWLAEGEQLLEGVLAQSRREHPEVPVETRVVHDDVVPALVGAARDADLLLIARRPHGPVHLAQLGATARALLDHATIPVLVLPPHRAPALGTEVEASGRLPR